MTINSASRANTDRDNEIQNETLRHQNVGACMDLKLDDDLQAIKAIKATLAINYFG